MTYDLKIEGARIVDGTGREAYDGDVGIQGGRIVELGRLSGGARRTIDAKGALVTPGFVDVHSHYDGQISWDDELAPSSWHGITTCLMGSCGVGFAPVRDEDHDRLIRLMEGVEDIPESALAEGITWGWSTFGEYLDRLSERPRLIDIGAQVPHDALRMFAMGERATYREPANEADVALMRRELGAALDAGAFGFSTGRTDNHRGKDGSPTPSSEAGERELAELAKVLSGRGRRILQAVSDFDMATDRSRFDAEFDILEDMARASGMPLSISVMQRTGDSEQWRRIFQRIERANAAGLELRAQVAPRAIGVLLGLEATFHPFMGFPTYKKLSQLPIAERVAELQKPEVKTRLLGESSERVAGDGSSIPPLADQLLANLDFVSMSLFKLNASNRLNYEPARESSLFGDAMRRGVRPLEAVYDALLEDQGRALLYFPIYNYASGTLDEVGEMLRHKFSIIGLGDGGAHVGTICDASYPSFVLSHWVRDRSRDRLSLERAVQMLSADGAAWLGLSDRGTVEVGKRADLNVIDLSTVELEAPHLVRDLPAGGRRLLQAARGYLATVVAGEIVRENGATTDARPGRILRAGAR
ncbi:MAG: amidohydrolase family protein [Polyangiaceae bacterium]